MSETIEELMTRKATLKMELEGIAMTNIAGRTLDEIVALNVRQAKTQKELYQIEAKIKNWIEA